MSNGPVVTCSWLFPPIPCPSPTTREKGVGGVPPSPWNGITFDVACNVSSPHPLPFPYCNPATKPAYFSVSTRA